MKTNTTASIFGRLSGRCFTTALAIFLVLESISALTAGPVWIIKSLWDTAYGGRSSLPPTTLLKYEEETGAVTELGKLRIAGSEVDLNGLALAPDGTLYAFELVGSPMITGSRLVRIDPASLGVSPIGEALTGVSIRGACCDPLGNIIAIDSKNGKLHEISPAGLVQRTIALALPLKPPGTFEPDSDITRLADGRYVLSAWLASPYRTVIYQVDIATGAMNEIGADAGNQPFDPYGMNSPVYTLGLTGSPSDATRIISLEGNGQEDLLAYQLPAFTRSLLSPNVPPVPLDDAGGGDLAAAVAEVNEPNRAPVALCKDVTVAAGPNGTANASVDDGSYDPDGDPITLSQTPAGPYPIGTTRVTLLVTDDKGASGQCVCSVTVVDVSPPAFTWIAATPDILWPPNHQMVPVALAGEITDNADGPVTVKIVSVSSNEPENGLGDGDTDMDWQVTDDLSLLLRAERSGKGSGRVYTITVEATDAAGNTSTAARTVVVPKNMRKK